MKKYISSLVIFLFAFTLSAQQGYRYTKIPGTNNKYTVPYKEIKPLAYAATITLAPTQEETTYNIAQLTGALTLNVTVTPCYTADKMSILFVADGTNRVVTFSTGFSANGTLTVAASGKAIVSFVFNGAAWYECTRQNLTSGGTMLADNGSAAAPSISFSSTNDLGLYRVSATELGITAGGVKAAGVSTTGVVIAGTATSTGNFIVGSSTFSVTASSGNTSISGTLAVGTITEKTSGAGITISKAVIQKGTVTSYTTTATITAAELAGGIIKYDGTGHTLTLPTATDLGTQLSAGAGTVFEFTLLNITGGSGTATIAVGANIVAASAITGGTTLTLAGSATVGTAMFRLVFLSATAATISRIN